MEEVNGAETSHNTGCELPHDVSTSAQTDTKQQKAIVAVLEAASKLLSERSQGPSTVLIGNLHNFLGSIPTVAANV